MVTHRTLAQRQAIEAILKSEKIISLSYKYIFNTTVNYLITPSTESYFNSTVPPPPYMKGALLSFSTGRSMHDVTASIQYV